MKRRYVAVSDLIMNGSDNCTILYRKPHTDYITIVEDDNNAAHLGSVMITHGEEEETLVWRTMRDDIMETELWLTVGDLDDARGMLFRDKMCSGCYHFNYCRCFFIGSDNWDNYKAGSCPNRMEVK
jgi:hypothetical protein